MTVSNPGFLSHLIFTIIILILCHITNGFSTVNRLTSIALQPKSSQKTLTAMTPAQFIIFRSKSKNVLLEMANEEDDFFTDGYGENEDTEDNGDSQNMGIMPLQDGELLSDGVLSQLEGGQPSQLAIMKQLLGINIFTYILAALIALFLSLNFALGPGWLGQVIGLEGTGTFTQISDSLPDSVDLSSPDNLLDF